MAWPGAPTAALEREGLPFRPVDEVLGPEGLAAADGAARTWARVWGRLPLADGKSFRELVEWRGSSLLWSATEFLLEQTAGPRCARTAEAALRLLEATAAREVDAPGVGPADALLLSRACTAQGVLYHGRVGGTGRPLPVSRPAVPSGLGRFLSGVLAPARPKALPTPVGRAGRDARSVLALVGGGEERDRIGPLLRRAAEDIELAVAPVSVDDLPRWETRAARRATSEAEALLRERLTRLSGTPGVTASYAHRGVGFADLAAGDLDALLRGSLPVAVRRLEASLALLASARPTVVLLALDGRDERRSLVHACSVAGTAAVVVRTGRAGSVDRADGGPQPAAVCDWEPGRDPGPVVEALRKAARGRVGAG